jgi:hypothetical protein
MRPSIGAIADLVANGLMIRTEILKVGLDEGFPILYRLLPKESRSVNGWQCTFRCAYVREAANRRGRGRSLRLNSRICMRAPVEVSAATAGGCSAVASGHRKVGWSSACVGVNWC